MEALNAPQEGDTPGRLAAKKARVTFAKSPIRPFFVLFEHACALDVNLIRTCFAGCQYCFAVANRKAKDEVLGVSEDPTDYVIKKIQKSHSPGYNPRDYFEVMIRERYPIVFSNNVEPFLPAAEEKYRLGERMLKTCLEYKQVLRIQTKEVFTPNVRDLIVEGKDLFNVYVSVTTLDDEIALKHETGCIPPSERLKRIEYLTSRGVEVCVGMNPFIPEWHTSPGKTLKDFVKRIKDSGAVGIYTDPFHLTKKQEAVIAKDMLKYQFNRFNEFFTFEVPLLEEWCAEVGLRLYYQGRHNDNFYKGFTERFKIFPFTGHHYARELYRIWKEQGENPLLVTWKSLEGFYSSHPLWNHVIDVAGVDPVMANSTEGHRQVRSALGIKNTFGNILKFMFNNPGRPSGFIDAYCPYLVDYDDDGGLENMEDDDGNLYYIYDPNRLYEDDFIIYSGEPLPDLVELE